MQINSTIITECLPLLTAELEKLNRKAKKLGCNPITFTQTEPYMRATSAHGLNVVDNVVDVVIEGEPIKLNGWRFIGRVEAVPNSTENLIFAVHGEKTPEQYRTGSPYTCEHCGQNRVRKATWVVGHDDGSYKQVGSSCMDDFFKARNPERAISWWMGSMDKLLAYLKDLEQKSSQQVVTGTLTPYAPAYINAVRVLELACQAVRMNGGRYEFGDNGRRSVPETAWCGYFGPPVFTDSTNQDDADMAARIVDFVMARRRGSAYYTNLSVMFLNDKVQARNIRYICSVVYAYLRAQGQGKQVGKNEHVGLPPSSDGKVKGTRFRDLKLTVTYVLGLTSQWHENYDWLIIMVDDEGRTFKWVKTSAGMVDKGDKLVLTGTVKAHEDYKGTKQTVLTRCTITSTEKTTA
jgi:hypothetical protein